MKRWVLAAGLSALSLGTVSLTVATSNMAWAQADVVAEREAGMKRMGGHLQAIKAVVDTGGPVGPVAERAEDMRNFFQNLPTRFPAGSGEGNKALPAIWSDSAGFASTSTAAAEVAAKLASAAAANDSAGVAAAFREVAGSCGTCHRSFRAR
jgi:cytochrome c556